MSMTHDDVTRAARTMIDVEPPQDLEARIRRRLDAVTPAANARRWPWVAALATAATLTLTLTVMLSRSSEVPEFRSAEGPQSAVRGPQSAVHLPSSPSPQLATSRPIRLPEYRTISASELEWMARRIPALDVIDPIQPEPMAITPLTMTPLVTPPVFGDPDAGRQ